MAWFLGVSLFLSVEHDNQSMDVIIVGSIIVVLGFIIRILGNTKIAKRNEKNNLYVVYRKKEK